MQCESARVFISLCCLVLIAFTADPSVANAPEPPWPRISLTPLQGHLSAPIHVTHAGDGSKRLFIVEQAGRIRIRKRGVLLAAPFLDIGGPHGRVSCCGERGLLSAAFPPDYATKQYFYVYYTNLRGNIVIARYHTTTNPDIADPTSAEILLTIPHPHHTNHNGGQLAFSPRDGISTSAQETAAAAETRATMLRIHVHYSVRFFALM